MLDHFAIGNWSWVLRKASQPSQSYRPSDGSLTYKSLVANLKAANHKSKIPL